MPASLFDGRADPVAASAGSWLTGVVGGSLALTLCVLAIALVGFVLMSGRLAIRDALRVVVGCFVLLGAPAIAAGLLSTAHGVDEGAVATRSSTYVPAPPPQLPPAEYDPYAGASLRLE